MLFIRGVVFYRLLHFQHLSSGFASFHRLVKVQLMKSYLCICRFYLFNTCSRLVNRPALLFKVLGMRPPYYSLVEVM